MVVFYINPDQDDVTKWKHFPRNGWVNTREAGDLRRYRANYEVTVMLYDLLDQPVETCKTSVFRETLGQLLKKPRVSDTFISR